MRTCATCGGPINRGGVASARNRRCLACRTAAVMATFTPPTDSPVEIAEYHEPAPPPVEARRRGVARRRGPWVCAVCELPESAHTTRDGRSPVCNECRASLERKGRRWCATCASVKPADGFSKTLCRDCKKAYNVRYYAAHAERERERARAKYLADPQAHHARVSAWRRTPEGRRRANGYERAYRARNAERWQEVRKEQCRRYRERYAERLREKSRERHQRRKLAAFQRLFRGAPRAR